MSASESIKVTREPSILPKDVCAIFQHAYWAVNRRETDVARMLSASHLIVTARRDGLLIGFGRAWGDGVYRSVIDDIVVVPEERSKGVGCALLEFIAKELSAVDEVALSCRVEMAPFYERFGFQRYTGAHLKRKRTFG